MRTYKTKPEHGLLDVKKTHKGFEVWTRNTCIGKYSTEHYLLIAITKDFDHGYTFDSYFGKPKKSNHVNVFDLFEAEPTLGIDLAKRGGEVRKLLFAGFGSRISRHGYDPEEVLQEVYRGLLARNKGICPFDRRKSSFGHYCHLVINCCLNNFHRREARRQSIEQVGVAAPSSMIEDEGAETGSVDASLIAEKALTTTNPSISEDEMDGALSRLQKHLTRKTKDGVQNPIAIKVARLLSEGLTQQEIAQKLAVSPNQISLAIKHLRENTADWL